MMTILLPDQIDQAGLALVGGKALALAALSQAGFRVPPWVCVTTQAYNAFIDGTGLRERILLELNRKDFKEMRWEEIWDCATRIRNLFGRSPLPPLLARVLDDALDGRFDDKAVAVRSSAPDEDAARSSFAGLHESYVQIRGKAAIVDHIRKVWASLWSDAALLYRQELGLDVAHSAMAVVIQEMISGQSSGIAFSQSPNDPSQAVVEAVYGLNQGLVDGRIEPDRWIFDKDTGRLLAHQPACREKAVAAAAGGTQIRVLDPSTAGRPPLQPEAARAVYQLAIRAENHFKAPQDVEWTLMDGQLFVLQARPVTTPSKPAADDQRAWYLSLHRSFDNLEALRQRIEEEHVPAMRSAAAELAAVDLQTLTDGQLAAQIRRCWEINTHWVEVYWSDFIPFAHGIRLFGQIYNDALKPEDPYEFIDLLTQTDMASLERNRLLVDLAAQVRRRPELEQCLISGDCAAGAPDFHQALEDFVGRFGDLSCTLAGGTQCTGALRPLAKILLTMAKGPELSKGGPSGKNRSALMQRYLEAFAIEKRAEAQAYLDLARASYQMRDDDNIFIDRIESQLMAAVQEGRRRLGTAGGVETQGRQRQELAQTLSTLHPDSKMHPSRALVAATPESVKPRQLIGQPAGPGIARGPARVIVDPDDLLGFAHGDILVCDAVDPTMTFVVPLAAAVVERRGGMLIHGAIIAREYGLPCVTGVPDAARLIRTGDALTVDGYLGIVTVGGAEL